MESKKEGKDGSEARHSKGAIWLTNPR